jgi:glycosyltransferase involved in cell wall biosynthesis
MIAAVAVVVPANNEQDCILACIESIEAARSVIDADLQLIVVLDACVDGTENLVGPLSGVTTVHSPFGRVGAARALGCAQALARFAAGGHRLIDCWIANTDADSQVPVDWLVRMLDAADAGADVVLGTVVPGPGLVPVAERRWHLGHDLVEGHRYVHGANLGVRASSYVQLGGWPDLRTGEDVALAGQAERAGLVTARLAGPPVVTSSRLHGRAPEGFAGYLNDLIAEPA